MTSSRRRGSSAMDDYLSGEVIGNMDDMSDVLYQRIYETDDPITTAKKTHPVVVLTEQEIHQRVTHEVAATAEVLCVPADWALVLLCHYGWDPLRLHEDWFADPDRVSDAVGLAGDSDVFPGDGDETGAVACGICSESKPAAEMLSAAECAHRYCQECCRRHVATALDDGRCVGLRCPDETCRRVVLRGTAARLAGGGGEAYEKAVARAYVDARRPWLTPCTATAGCGCAAEVPADDGADGDVACPRCGGAPHWPAGCGAAAGWARDADQASADWMLLHTKHCPSCRRPIERVEGCDNIVCAAPCLHRFCWGCLESVQESEWGNCAHGGGVRQASPETEEKEQRAKQELEQFLQYQDHWMANLWKRREAELEARRIREKRLPEAWRETERRTLEVAAEAWEQVAEGRRVLGNACAHGQSLRRADAARWELFAFQHRRVDAVLEALWDHAAKGPVAPEEDMKEFGAKLAALTRTTRHGVECFAKAVEEGMPGDGAPAPRSKRRRIEEASSGDR